MAACFVSLDGLCDAMRVCVSGSTPRTLSFVLCPLRTETGAGLGRPESLLRQGGLSSAVPADDIDFKPMGTRLYSILRTSISPFRSASRPGALPSTCFRFQVKRRGRRRQLASLIKQYDAQKEETPTTPYPPGLGYILHQPQSRWCCVCRAYKEVPMYLSGSTTTPYPVTRTSYLGLDVGTPQALLPRQPRPLGACA